MIIDQIRTLRCAARNSLFKKQVINRGFSIIANNCWGEVVYQELGLRYTTPFIGIFIFGPCYLRLLKDLKGYLGRGLRFIDRSGSRYRDEFKRMERLGQMGQTKNGYPIAMLGGDVEIHFLHYPSKQEAEEKWNRRVKRINWDNLFVKFDDWDGISGFVSEFEEFDLPHKVCFARKACAGLKSAVWLKSWERQPDFFNGAQLYTVSQRHFDIADWLNGGSGKFTPSRTIVNKLLYSSRDGIVNI